MMDLIVDGNAVAVPEEGVQTIADVVGSVSQNLDVKRRIVRVVVDGEDITGDADRHMRPKNGTERVEVTTGLASELALEMLSNIQEFHGALETELSRTADEFRLGNQEKSNEMFARCLDGLQILIRTTISVANLLQVDSTEVKAGSSKMSDATEQLTRVLNELIEAQKNNDTILTADLIEYELSPLLEDWGDARENLRVIGKAA
jgi:hypothetical protein